MRLNGKWEHQTSEDGKLQAELEWEEIKNAKQKRDNS